MPILPCLKPVCTVANLPLLFWFFHDDAGRHRYQQILSKQAAWPVEPTMSDEEEYSVEKVCDKRTNKGKVEYLLKWKG